MHSAFLFKINKFIFDITLFLTLRTIYNCIINFSIWTVKKQAWYLETKKG